MILPARFIINYIFCERTWPNCCIYTQFHIFWILKQYLQQNKYSRKNNGKYLCKILIRTPGCSIFGGGKGQEEQATKMHNFDLEQKHHIVHCKKKKLDSRSALRTRGRCEQHASRSRRGMHCEFIIQIGFSLSFIFFDAFIRNFYNYSVIIDNYRILLRNYA